MLTVKFIYTHLSDGTHGTNTGEWTGNLISALQSGELPGGKIGREWRIDRDKLREKIGGK